MAAQPDGRCSPEQSSDPLGVREFCKPGRAGGPLPRKMHIHTHARFGGQFPEIPRPSGIHELPRGPRLICFGRGMPRGPHTPGLLPKITLPEPAGLGKRKWGIAEALPRPGGGPSGGEKEGNWGLWHTQEPPACLPAHCGN